MTDVFGPSALATPANAVTISRVLLTPLLLVSIAGTGASWPGLALWVALSASDGIDGYLARRHGVTRSGAFLDPLADKFLVLGAMAVLVVTDVFWWLPVALVAGREVAMSLYRSVAGRSGVSVPARRSAKLKTVVQEVAVGLAICPAFEDNPLLATTVLWAATGLTLLTGAQYWTDARRHAPAA
ncbi:MAG: CDP-alcohol phosphatidyltransferase family protein [Acidimicrobiia bacterium]